MDGSSLAPRARVARPGTALRDEVGLAVAAGRRRSDPHRLPDRETVRRAEQLASEARSGNAEAMVADLLGLVSEHPSSERLQVLAARAIDRCRHGERSLVAWQGISARHPRSAEAFRLLLRWLSRVEGPSAASTRLAARFPARPEDLGELMVYARACDELKLGAEAESALEAAMAAYPDSEEPFLLYAQWLHGRGHLHHSFEVLSALEARKGPLAIAAGLRETLKRDIGTVSRIAPAASADGDVGNAVLASLLDRLAATRQAGRLLPRSFLGPVMMITGTLGAGGAERQLTNTAVGLDQAIQEGRQVAGRDVTGPVRVCVRSFDSRPDGAFFRPELTRRGIATWEYSAFEPYGGSPKHSLARDCAELLRFLPSQMVEGTERLTDVLASQRPDVLHIWQDGSILATGLAALLAGVPRIVLGVRTVPPIDRPGRMKPQYEVLYRRMLALPGVQLLANSRFAAARYADWLDLDRLAVQVVYNGLEELPRLPAPGDEATFGAFAARTPEADFTVGSVMRFDENKRPYLWLDAAAAVLEGAPSARFVLVGDGPLLAAAQEYAARLGIASRVLFTGRSSSVGYWLGKLDAFLLLSRFEGLPNVLIEAQHAGVPVYTTPAGGAAETVLEGETGHVFGDGESPDPREIAGWLLALRASPGTRQRISRSAKAWVESRFTVPHMLEATVEAYMA